MHRCTTACFSLEHEQGKNCLCSTNATRATLGLPPLYQDDGGHQVHGGISFPIESEPEDEAVYAMAEIETWIWFVIAVSSIAIVVGVASAVGLYLPH